MKKILEMWSVVLTVLLPLVLLISGMFVYVTDTRDTFWYAVLGCAIAIMLFFFGYQFWSDKEGKLVHNEHFSSAVKNMSYCSIVVLCVVAMCYSGATSMNKELWSDWFIYGSVFYVGCLDIAMLICGMIGEYKEDCRLMSLLSFGAGILFVGAFMITFGAQLLTYLGIDVIGVSTQWSLFCFYGCFAFFAGVVLLFIGRLLLLIYETFIRRN